MPTSLTIQYKYSLFSSTTIVNSQVSGLRPVLHCSLLSPPLCALQRELLSLILHLLLLGLLLYKPSRVEPKPFLQQPFLGAKWENPLLKELLRHSLKPRDRPHHLYRPVFTLEVGEPIQLIDPSNKRIPYTCHHFVPKTLNNF